MFKVSESRNCLEISLIVYAVLLSILTGITCVVSVVWLFVQVILIVKDQIDPGEDSSYFIAAILVAVITLSSIAYSFSVLLYLGMIRKNPAHLKAYCIYGNIVLLLCASAGIISLLLFAELLDPSELMLVGLTSLTVCVIYGSILRSIWSMYKKYRKEIQYKQIVVIGEKF